ncbi:MAG: antibiotic biosynthesis monooxygenase, partial [Planctomycetota bacterium]
ITRPSPHERGGRYSVLVRFATREHLERWAQSEARAGLVDEIAPLLVDGDRFTMRSGLDFWFTPEAVAARVPTRWKQGLVTWSAIFPIVWGLGYAFEPVFAAAALEGGGWERALRVLVVTAAAVCLMVYVVMPRYTRAVHRWLFR